MVLVQGHFAGYLPLCSRNEPVFLALCTPVAMPETRECVVQGSTHVFTTIHSMDMKILHLDRNGEFHLGYQKSSLQGVSWYELVHWDHLSDAQSKHKLSEYSCRTKNATSVLDHTLPERASERARKRENLLEFSAQPFLHSRIYESFCRLS